MMNEFLPRLMFSSGMPSATSRIVYAAVHFWRGGAFHLGVACEPNQNR